MTAPPPDGVAPARVSPGSRHDTGAAVQLFARAAGRVTGTEPPAIFLTLGRHRRLFWRWLWFAGGLMPGGRLPRRESELVILRVATLAESDYELAQHRRLGRRAGLTTAEIDRVAGGPGAVGWGDRDRLLLRAVDALVGTGDLDDDLWQAVRSELGRDDLAIELVLLVGHYQMLATALRALRVRPDRPARS